MGQRVLTRTRCDRCRLVHERGGTSPSAPPDCWSSYILTQRLAGPGWTNNQSKTATLCPNCADAVHQAALGYAVTAVEAKA